MKLILTLVCFVISSSSITFGQTVPIKIKNDQYDRGLTKFLKSMPFTNDNSVVTNDLIHLIDSLNRLDFVNTKKLNSLFYIKLSEELQKLYKKLNKDLSIADFKGKAGQLQKIESLGALNSINDINTVKTALAENYSWFQNNDASSEDLKKFEKDILNHSLYYRYKSRLIKSNIVLFPVHNSVDAQYFYNSYISDKKYLILKNSLLSFGTDGGRASLFNEIYSDFFGPIRFGFGILISNKQTIDNDSLNSLTRNDTSKIQKDAIQRLIGGGGNGILSLSLPLLDYVNNRENLFFKVFLTPKIGIDVPKIGTEKNDYALNSDNGLDGAIFFNGALEQLTLFSTFRSSLIVGNKTFYNSLNKLDQKAFLLNQISFGFTVGNFLRFSYNFYSGSKFIKENFKNSISVSVIPIN